MAEEDDGGGLGWGGQDETSVRMKAYEAACSLKLDPNLPFIIRLDGHRFSKFTKGFKKPFDPRMFLSISSQLADPSSTATTTTTTTDESTPSTEPSTTKATTTPASSTSTVQTIMYNGKVQKIVSLAASKCGVRFYINMTAQMDPTDAKLLAKVDEVYFDARVFNLPSETEIFHNVLWRVNDCKRNSKHLLGHYTFNDQKTMENLNPLQVVKKLKEEKGIDWHAMPPAYKWGVLIKKQQFSKVGHNPKTGIDVVTTRTRLAKGCVNLLPSNDTIAVQTKLLVAKFTNECPSLNDTFVSLRDPPPALTPSSSSSTTTTTTTTTTTQHST